MNDAYQFLMFVLALCIYVTRLLYAINTPRNWPATIVMICWAGSLLTYVGGSLDAYQLAFSVYIRMLGAVLMVVSVPLSPWIKGFRGIGDYIGSRVSLGEAYGHIHDGAHRLAYDPVFVAFLVCVMGAVLLSANLVILMTSSAASLVMGVSMKRAHRPA